MKNRSKLLTVFFFAAALLFVFVSDSNGNQSVSPGAASLSSAGEGPEIEVCTKDGLAYAYSSHCTGSGEPCTDVPCPPPPVD